ncbi:MAG TPA: ATP-binding protein [Polyangiaceae bacterium]|nr:ATP-binding protein [Polyangiaceae bacterium]
MQQSEGTSSDMVLGLEPRGGAPASIGPAADDWRPADRPAASGHTVQFYEDDDFLDDSVARFLGAGLVAGEPLVVIGTRARGEALCRRLEASSFDVERARAAGELTLVDARAVLATIMKGGLPDEAAFREVVGGCLERAGAGRPGGRVRVYGEMVDLLCQAGHHEAALRLESWWNALADARPFRLLCAYRLDGFGRSEHAGPFGRVCDAHERALPAEGYSALDDPRAASREVARLQQRARALEAEVERRERLERELARALAGGEAVATERAQLSEQARAAARLKDEFLATVSHELRTPLNAILGWARVLRAGAVPGDKVGRALETIERNALAQARLVDDLLDASRLVSGKLRLDVRPLALAPIVEAALASLGPALEAKGLGLERAIDPAVGPVLGDPDRLQQAVWNLASNAIKFTPKGGRVRLGLARDDASARLSVSDSGQGIAPHQLSAVFERFMQADVGSGRAHGGLGLGLALTRHLVELHGGTVEAQSEGEGKGATFVVRLPLA